MSERDPNFPLTDLGNGERFAADHAGHILHAAGDWWVWDGRRWIRDELNAVEQMAKQTARGIWKEARRAGADDRKIFRDWAYKSEQNRALDAMLKRARSEPAIARAIGCFDADRFALNCHNGTVNLKTGAIAPHNPASLITKLAPVTYDPAGTCPQWLTFLARIFADSQPLIDYVQKLLGLACTGEADEQLMPIFYGTGQNGKSTLVEVLQMILGDHACNAPETLLAETGRKEHPAELALLQGRRLVVASETEKDAKLRIQQVKKLTGELTVTARFMNGNFFEFPRTHHLLMMTNNKPRIPEDTEAAWRRLRLIPFTVKIPDSEKVKGLGTKLFAEEASGILNWLAQGCRQWLAEGLDTPAEVTTATKAYRDESDPLKEFLDDCCGFDPNYQTGRGDLRKAYLAYCESQATKPVSARFFNERIKTAGVVESRTKAQRFWIGIFLNDGSGVSKAPQALFESAHGYQGELGEN